jgi:hypothetical protein
MNCEECKDKILDLFDRAGAEKVSLNAEAHMAVCTDCAAFMRKQTTIDTRLAALLIPPEMSDQFETELLKEIRQNRKRCNSEVLPDVVHFATCAVATIVCAFVLPIAAPNVFAAGIITAFLTYVLMTMIRDSLQDAGQRDL